MNGASKSASANSKFSEYHDKTRKFSNSISVNSYDSHMKKGMASKVDKDTKSIKQKQPEPVSVDKIPPIVATNSPFNFKTAVKLFTSSQLMGISYFETFLLFIFNISTFILIHFTFYRSEGCI